MGKIKPDLVGAFTNKVGGVVYYVKDGVNYVRSKSKKEYTSKTPLQVDVRLKFGSASQMASRVKEIAKVGFPQRKRGMTPKNAWHSANKKCFQKTEEGVVTNFEGLQFSSDGSLFPPEVTLSYDQESRVYKVMHAEMPDETNCHADDIVYVVLLDTEQLFVRLVAVGKRGESGEETIDVSRLWSNSVCAYCFATSADGKIVSRTLHLAIS